MSYVICPSGVAALRSRPDHRGELISQLLFGEMAEVLDRKGRQWLRLRMLWDNTVGWCASNEVLSITAQEQKGYAGELHFNLDLHQTLMEKNHVVPIPLGAALPNFDGMRLQCGTHQFHFTGTAASPSAIKQPTAFVLKMARRYLYVPYLHGGSSSYGIDGPGLLQQLTKLVGKRFPRQAARQIDRGENVDFIEESRAGDFAFFENKAGRIDHGGILLGDDLILHADGHVRIDQVDHYGIFNVQTRRYTHRLRVIRRLLPPAAADPKNTDVDNMIDTQQVAMF